MLRKIRALSLSAMLLSSAWLGAPAFAESLNDAMGWAYQENPDLQAARAGVRQQLEATNLTNAKLRPQVNFNANYGIQTGDLYAGNWRDNDRLSATLSATLLLYDGGRSALAVDAGLANTRAANLRLNANEQQILLATAQAYLNVLRDRSLVSTANKNIETLNTRLQSARVAYETGAATITETAQTEAAVAQAKADLASTQAALAVSEANYTALTGHKPGQLAAISNLPKVPSSLDEAQRIGVLNSPLVMAAVETERAAQIELRRTKDAYMPQVDLSASATRSNTLDGSGPVDSNQIGVGVTIPIYTGGQISAVQAQAEAVLEARSAETNATRLQVQQNIANAWAQLQNAGSAISAMQQVVEAQSLADEGAEVEYEVGALTVTDRLDAQQNLISAQTSLLTAQYQQQFAVFQLVAAMGQLTIEGMKLNLPKIDPLKPNANASDQPKTESQTTIENILDRWSQ